MNILKYLFVFWFKNKVDLRTYATYEIDKLSAGRVFGDGLSSHHAGMGHGVCHGHFLGVVLMVNKQIV